MLCGRGEVLKIAQRFATNMACLVADLWRTRNDSILKNWK